MKKIQLFLLLTFLSAHFYGQQAEQYLSGVVVANQFAISKPLTELPPFDETKIVFKEKESGDRKKRKPQEFPLTVEKDGEAFGNDRNSLQTEGGGLEKGQNKIAWAGQTASGFRPYDPSGAVGPNHYVQMINGTTFKVYDKTNGNVLLTQTLGNLWTPATPNAGDPIVMYDKAADRWFLAQFGSGTNDIYIALSTSSNPMGSYYTWTFTSPAFPDYLKFSVWQDGYYMTSNQGTQRVFAFERSAMLVGTPAARSVFQTYTPPQGGGFFCPIPGDASDGNLPPAGTPCPIMSFSDNGWGGANIDAVQIYNMTVDWVPTTPTAVITLASAVPTAAFDASYESTWDNCPQPGTTQKLDAIGGIIQYRAQWKSWPGYNTVVLNWSVRISATQRSIKWVELRQNQASGIWSVYQEGIYTPDGATRWMGSIAMDNAGSIGLSYIKSDATSIYPGLYWTGRRACDPLGTLPLTETTVIAGTGFQTGTNRVGDYAHCTLDPDGFTFWNTSEYMGGTSGGSAARTHIFSYQINPCSSDAIVNISVTGGSNPSCQGNNITFTATAFNQGTSPVYQWKVDGANVGTNSSTYSTSSLTNGQVVTCVMTSNLPGVTNNPATSNAITISITPSVSASVSIAQTGGTNPACPGAFLTFTATPTNGGVAPVYQWQVNGVNAGTNSPTFSSNSIANGQVVTCLMTSSIFCAAPAIATSNPITITIGSSSPAVSIAQTAGTNPSCAGVSTTFTATVTNGSSPSYQWKVNGSNVGTNSPTFTTTGLTNGQSVSCTVTSSPSCPVSTTLGTGVLLNPVTGSTAGLAAAYPTYWGNGRQQYLILASELTALGITAGPIYSVSFNINGTVGDPVTLNGYTIKMASTSATALTTTFQTPTFTTVFGPTNYTPTLNSWNLHNFSSAFNWNGTSNVLVDICFSNQVVGNAAYQSYQSTTPFVSTTYYEADNAGGAGACTTTTGVTGSRRPNMIFSSSPAPVTSNSNAITMTINSSVTPSVSIAITSGANPTCAGSSVTFTATPTNGGTTPSYQWKVNGSNTGTNSPTFTTTSLTNGQIVTCEMTSNAACASPLLATSNGITMTINSAVVPSVSIAITAGTNPACAGSSTTFTATPSNGGSTPSYQWKINGVNAGTNSPTFTSSSLANGQVVTCELTSNAPCASPTLATSNSITMTINAAVAPSVNIAITAGSNPSCSGSSITFTATPVNGGSTPSYQWKINGANAGTNSPTFTSSSLTNGQVVTCEMTSNAACASPTLATSNGITITINTVLVPAVSIALTSGTNPSCVGSSVTFTATPTNGGTTPSYQWKVNGTNAGTNSPTFTTSSLTNGQIVTCEMTSNAACASPLLATSNGVTMTINSAVVPSVSIAITAGTNPACAGSSITFTATPSNGGSTPSYQWKINGANAGTNSPTFTTTSLTNGQIVTCEMTSNAACASPLLATSNGVTMTINSAVVPSVSIAITAGTNPACAGSSITFTATPSNGGSTPSYQWKINGANAGTNSPTFTSSSLTNGQVVTCEMTSNAPCATPTLATSNGITMTINAAVAPSVNIAITAGSNPSCSGSSITFTATPVNGGSTPSYQWKINGANAGTNSPTFTSSSLTNGQIVTCEMTSNAACASPTLATSNGITITINTVLVPAVSIALTSGSNPSCVGSSVSFTATPTNGGTTPFYQWKVNGSNAGTNSPTFTTSSLTNGQIVTCEMTSNDACASPLLATSNGIAMTINSVVVPSVSIAITAGTNPACSGSSITFTATPSNGGSTPSYQWKINGSNAGTNSPTFTTTSLTNGQVVTCEMTSNAPCASPTLATSNGITVTINAVVTPAVNIAITAGSNPSCSGSSITFTATPSNGGSTPAYQWKINGSNVGTNSPTFSTTSLTNGQIVTCEMTSNAPCTSQTLATSNGIAITINSSITWYQDSDGDTYGNALVTISSCTSTPGYVTQAGDCNDNNAGINPAAVEICFNGIDEDCDGTADDGCTALTNDQRPNATAISVGAYNTCSSISGDLTLATVSPESQSTVITGQDLWYSFVALSPGAQIKVSTTAINVLVELQNSAGVMIDSENIQSTKSNENLNIGSLTPGATYYVAVRNFNSAQGTGVFTLCISDLPASGCLTPAPSYTMCSKFKAIVVNASSYVYNFTSTQTNITYNRTQPSATLDLYKVTGGMPTGANYDARVDAIYTVQRGNGTTESITVQGVSTCNFLFAADPLLILATTQDCPNPRPLGVNIRSNTTVCYASAYQWEFQKADLSEPVFTIMGGSTQYLTITSALGFVPGTTYNVRIRVTYLNGYTNPWGPVSCLLIAGGSGMNEYQQEDSEDRTIVRMDDFVSVSLYPNPGNGEMINLEIDGIESGLVDFYLTDAMGRVLATKQYFVDGMLQTQWIFDTELSSGMYLVNMVYDNRKIAQRIIIE